MYIIYLDADNFYGWTISQYLPTSGFRKRINKTDMAKYKEDSRKSVILEIDLEY